MQVRLGPKFGLDLLEVLGKNPPEAKALYDQRQKWLQDTLRLVEDPYLRLALFFTGS